MRTTGQHTGSEQNTFQVQLVALKRLQAETAQELDALLPAILDRASSIQRRALTFYADPPSSDISATRLAALLTAILDRAFKGKL